MNFSDTKEEAIFRQQAREWLRQNVPQASELAGMDEVERARFWYRKRFQGGWTCLTWPEKYGGKGASPIQDVIWDQEEQDLGAPSSQILGVGPYLAGPTLMVHGSDAQREKYLPAIVSGQQHWTQIFSEPAAGSDLAGLRTKATATEGGWLINGQKIWTTNAHRADMGIMVTRTDPTVARHKGLSYFIVDLQSKGIEVRPIKQINGEADFNEVFFTDVFIPDENLVGKPGDGWRIALTTLMNERATAFEEDSDMYLNSKHLIGLAHTLNESNSSLVDDSDLRSRLADWYCAESGLKYTTYRLLTALSRGDTPGPENSIMKLVAAAQSQDMASYGLDLIAQCGVSREDGDLTDAYRRFYYAYMTTPGTRLLGGTDEIMLNIIAERVLGMPADTRTDKNIPFNEIPTSA